MKVGTLDSDALVFREDVVRVCSTSSHLAGLPNRASFCLSKGSLKVACNPRDLRSGLHGTPVWASVDTTQGIPELMMSTFVRLEFASL